MKRKQYEDDDGRQIADMSGLNESWYSYRIKKKPKKKMQSDDSEKTIENLPPLSKEDSKSLVFRAVGAGLLVGFIFIIGALLFILFCLFVWFK